MKKETWNINASYSSIDILSTPTTVSCNYWDVDDSHLGSLKKKRQKLIDDKTPQNIIFWYKIDKEIKELDYEIENHKKLYPEEYI